MEQVKDKKLGFFLSFKKSEIALYNSVKNTNNYSTLIKKLLAEYFISIENSIDKNSTMKNENTLEVTVDDICKIISSVTSNDKYIHSDESVIDANLLNQYSKNDDIPESMLVGL